MNKMKILNFIDLLKYAEKYQKLVDEAFLRNNGFSPIEAEELVKTEEVKMLNEKLLTKKNNEIGELNAKIIELERIIKENINNKVTTKKGFGWKGKDSITIKETGSDFIITEHRKTKTSGKITNNSVYVDKARINIILSIIKGSVNKGESMTYREMVKEIKNFFKFKVSIDAFNGGHNRKRYFKYYYYPIKILEYLKIINYSGRGKITLINTKKKIKIWKEKKK